MASWLPPPPTFCEALPTIGVNDSSVLWWHLILWIVAWGFFYQLTAFLSPVLFPKVYGSLTPGQKGDWNSRVLSTVHAVVVAVFAFNELYVQGDFLSHSLFATCSHCEFLLMFFLGYLFNDLIIILVNYNEMSSPLSTTLHHVFAFGSFLVFMSHHSFHFAGLCFMASEASTPFVNLRWYLSVHKPWKDSALYLINGLTMVVVFFFVRIVGGAYLWYKSTFWWHELMVMPTWYFTLFLFDFTLITTLNCFWFYLMASGAFKVLFGGKSGEKSGKPHAKTE